MSPLGGRYWGWGLHPPKTILQLMSKQEIRGGPKQDSKYKAPRRKFVLVFNVGTVCSAWVRIVGWIRLQFMMTLLQVAPLWVVSPHQYLRTESTKYTVPIFMEEKKETTMHKWVFPMIKRQQFQSLSSHLCQLLLAVAFSPSPRHVIDALASSP